MLRMHELDIRPGALSASNPRERELRVRHAQLSVAIDHIRNPVKHELSPDNPHSKEYDAARRDYVEYGTEVRELQARHDAAAGDERVEVGDRLRQLIGTGVELREAYDGAKRKYQEWETDHVIDGGSRPSLQALEEQFAAVRRELNTMAQ